MLLAPARLGPWALRSGTELRPTKGRSSPALEAPAAPRVPLGPATGPAPTGWVDPSGWVAPTGRVAPSGEAGAAPAISGVGVPQLMAQTLDQSRVPSPLGPEEEVGLATACSAPAGSAPASARAACAVSSSGSVMASGSVPTPASPGSSAGWSSRSKSTAV